MYDSCLYDFQFLKPGAFHSSFLGAFLESVDTTETHPFNAYQGEVNKIT